MTLDGALIEAAPAEALAARAAAMPQDDSTFATKCAEAIFALGTSPVESALAPPVAAPVTEALPPPPLPPVGDNEAEQKRAARRERNRLHAVASRKRRREKVEQLEADNARLKQELDSMREENTKLHSWISRLQNPISVEVAAAIIKEKSGPLSDENAPAWLGVR